MALEESGIDLVIEGLGAFESGFESANASLLSIENSAYDINQSLETLIDIMMQSASTAGTDVASGMEEAADSTSEANEESDTLADTLSILADVSIIASTAAGALGSAFSAVGDLAKGVLSAGLSAAKIGLSALTDGLMFSIKEAMAAEKITAQLDAVLRSTGGAAGVTKDAALELADALSRTSTFTDDAILTGENLLLTFTNIGSEVFPDATQAMVDMAAAMGTDVSSGAIQLGKALNDPIAGISALSRVGVTFTEDQKKVIARLVETGDVAGAQRIILEELSKEFGGSAAAAADTFSGRMTQLQNRLDNVAEGIGNSLLPILTTLFDNVIAPALPIIEDLALGFQGFIEALISGQGIADSFEGVWGRLNEIIPGVGTALNEFTYFVEDLYNFVVANLPAIQESFTTAFNSIMVAVNLVASVWRTDLQPALSELFTAIFGQGPTAQQVMDSLLNAIVAGAQAVATWFATTLVPAVKQFSEWITNEFQPRAIELKEWLEVNIPIAIQALADFWNNVLMPAVDAAVAFWTGTLVPNMVILQTWLAINLPIAIQALTDFWTNTLQPALVVIAEWLGENVPAATKAITDFWTNTLLPVLTTTYENLNTYVIPIFTALAEIFSNLLRLAIEGLVALWNTYLYPAFESLAKLINDTLGPAFTNFNKDAVGPLTSAMDSLKTALSDVFKWLGDIATQLSNIHIPPNLTPGSPTPFEIGLRGAANAAKMLTGEVRDLGKEYDGLGGASLGLGSTGGRSMSIPELLIGRMIVSELVMGALPIASLGGTGGRSIGIMEQNNITLAPTYNGSRRDPPSMDDLGSLALAMT